jgi:hypothetical protein
MQPQDERIQEATSLEELLDAMREIEAECAEIGSDPQFAYDATALPVFGGAEPPDTLGIWSWDESRLLTGTCTDDMRIVPR